MNQLGCQANPGMLSGMLLVTKVLSIEDWPPSLRVENLEKKRQLETFRSCMDHAQIVIRHS
jgi:hypothetical protein